MKYERRIIYKYSDEPPIAIDTSLPIASLTIFTDSYLGLSKHRGDSLIRNMIKVKIFESNKLIKEYNQLCSSCSLCRKEAAHD